MSRNRKRKKKPVLNQTGGYKKFLRDLHQALCRVGAGSGLALLSLSEKRSMYDLQIKIRNPVGGNDQVAPSELKTIRERGKELYKKETTGPYESELLSCYQSQLVHSYFSKLIKKLEKTSEPGNPELMSNKGMIEGLFEAYINQLSANYYQIIAQMGRPDYKYFGVSFSWAPLVKAKPTMDMIIEVFGYPARKCMIRVDGILRPAFRLGKPVASEPYIEWISVLASLLQGAYSGKNNVLDVYIQSHALKRLKERLDLLSEEAINYAIWENITRIDRLEKYQHYLLLPFDIMGVKVGYLVGKVVADKLLFRTFLFITHNSAPEGKRFKAISGLVKEDITYWRIDRLSAFANLDEDKYPELIRIFNEAGMEYLLQLKNKDFDKDMEALQSSNLDGLTEYIKKGMEKMEELWNDELYVHNN